MPSDIDVMCRVCLIIILAQKKIKKACSEKIYMKISEGYEFVT